MGTVSEKLFVLQEGERTGPFSRQHVLEMLETGSVSQSDYVWAKGMKDWVPLETILEDLWSTPMETRPSPPKSTRSTPARSGSFAGIVGSAFGFPFRGYGWATVLTGTIVLTGLEWFKMLPAAPGILNLFLSIVAWGYILLMLQGIIVQTAMKDAIEPQWPDFEGFGELIGKCFQWIVIILVCFGPAIYLGIRIFPEDGGFPSAMGVVMVAVVFVMGAAYFPMTLLGVAVFDTLGALNPMLVARSIVKVPGHYFVVLIIFGGLMGCSLLISILTEFVPILGTILYQFYSLWALMFLARILGGLYAVNSEKLGWI